MDEEQNGIQFEEDDKRGCVGRSGSGQSLNRSGGSGGEDGMEFAAAQEWRFNG